MNDKTKPNKKPTNTGRTGQSITEQKNRSPKNSGRINVNKSNKIELAQPSRGKPKPKG